MGPNWNMTGSMDPPRLCDHNGVFISVIALVARMSNCLEVEVYDLLMAIQLQTYWQPSGPDLSYK